MGDTEDAAAVYDRVSARAASLGVAIAPEELAELAVRHSMGGGELATPCSPIWRTSVTTR